MFADLPFVTTFDRIKSHNLQTGHLAGVKKHARHRWQNRWRGGEEDGD